MFNVDFEKTCDNVDWDLLGYVLLKKVFRKRWRMWIQGGFCFDCFIFNFISGRPMGTIMGEKGLGQSDSISFPI